MANQSEVYCEIVKSDGKTKAGRASLPNAVMSSMFQFAKVLYAMSPADAQKLRSQCNKYGEVIGKMNKAALDVESAKTALKGNANDKELKVALVNAESAYAELKAKKESIESYLIEDTSGSWRKVKSPQSYIVTICAVMSAYDSEILPKPTGARVSVDTSKELEAVFA